MALELSSPKPLGVSAQWGGARAVLWKITVNTYATGGLALAPATVGMTEIIGIVPVNGWLGYRPDYSRSTDKLLVYASGGTQATNAVDPNIDDAYLIIIGY